MEYFQLGVKIAIDDPKMEAARAFTMDFSTAFYSIKHNILSERLKKAPLNP